MRPATRLGLVAHCLLSAACAISYGEMAPAGVDVNCRGLPPRFVDGPSTSDAGLLWLRPDAERERRLGAEWCETVGGPVYVASPDRRIEAAPADSLVVVSWNMNVGGGDLGGLVEAELGVSCGGSDGIPASHARPFVLLVQEAHRRSARLPPAPSSSLIPPTIDPDEAAARQPDIVELARLCGLSLAYVPSMRNGPDSGSRPHEDKGNAILSNLPLLSPVAVELPFEAYRRVAVGAELDLDGRMLRVVSVHFDVTGFPFRVLLTGNQSRARQASGLIDALESLDGARSAGVGTVVGGDLNTWTSRETAVRLLRRGFPDSPPDDGLATRGVFPTDHVFFRSEAGDLVASGYGVLESDYGSDHHGRVLLLTTRERGSVQ